MIFLNTLPSVQKHPGAELQPVRSPPLPVGGTAQHFIAVQAGWRGNGYGLGASGPCTGASAMG